MTDKFHTIKPAGLEMFDRVIPRRPEEHRFAAHDLQALQEAMTAVPFTLADLVAVVRRYPRTIRLLAKEI